MLDLQRLAIFTVMVEAGALLRQRRLGANQGGGELCRQTAGGTSWGCPAGAQPGGCRLTDAGERFYQRSLQLLQEAENVLDDVRRDHHGLSGVLRITSTPGAQWWCRRWRHFSRQHPQLRSSMSLLLIMPI